MRSIYLLVGLSILLVPDCFAQQTKAVNSKTKAIYSRKKITEAEAKRIHEEQLAREGNTGIRRAYKRSEIEQLLHTQQSDWAGDVHENPAPSAKENSATASKNKPAAAKSEVAVITARPAPKAPKFIEGIVLERTAQ